MISSSPNAAPDKISSSTSPFDGFILVSRMGGAGVEDANPHRARNPEGRACGAGGAVEDRTL